MDNPENIPLDAEELTEGNLINAVIYGADDYAVGSVSHVQGAEMGGSVIVNVGGFLGIGTRLVALSDDILTFMRDQSDRVYATTTLTRGEIGVLPEHRH